MRNMKKIIFLIFLLPTISLASFDDLTLTSDAIIHAGAYTLHVQGTLAAIESIAVDANSFDITVLPGSSFSVSSAVTAGYEVSVVGSNAAATISCDTPSILTIVPGRSTSTVTVTPLSTCTATRHTRGGTVSPAAPSPVDRCPQIIGIQAYDSDCAPVVLPAPLTPPQPIASIAIPLTTSLSDQPAHSFFLHNLKQGRNNEDIRNLQKFLNTHGYIVSTTGPGSMGNETNYFRAKTKQALIKFQIANHIFPAAGYFGYITRGVINGL
jgi:hypothetical protein